MKIKIFGRGCQKCEKLLKNVNMALYQLEMEADVEKITDLQAIVNNGIMGTPALMIDGKLISTGRVFSTNKIKKILAK